MQTLTPHVVVWQTYSLLAETQKSDPEYSVPLPSCMYKTLPAFFQVTLFAADQQNVSIEGKYSNIYRYMYI